MKTVSSTTLFGNAGVIIHKRTKVLFSMKDPRIHPQTRKTHPNFRFDPYLKWIQDISMEAWILGVGFYLDEQTIGF